MRIIGYDGSYRTHVFAGHLFAGHVFAGHGAPAFQHGACLYSTAPDVLQQNTSTIDKDYLCATCVIFAEKRLFMEVITTCLILRT